MRWKLDRMLSPWYQETEFPVEECWLSQTQEGQTEVAVNHLKTARGEIWPKGSEKKKNQNYQDEDKSPQ